AHRHTSSAVYLVAEGQGCSIVNGERVDWQEHDVFALPMWAWHEHVNASDREPAVLLSFSDLPVLEALGLHREQEPATEAAR
ncbi:MAG TPA: cupin domain-containing protein, partial [Chloroflexota bacterium]